MSYFLWKLYYIVALQYIFHQDFLHESVTWIMPFTTEHSFPDL